MGFDVWQAIDFVQITRVGSVVAPEGGGAGGNMYYFSAGPDGIMVRASDPKRVSFLQQINQINRVIKFRKRSTIGPDCVVSH